MKVRRQRSLGPAGWRKIVGQVIVAVPFGDRRAQLPERVGSDAGVGVRLGLPRRPVLSFMALGPIIGWLLYLAWITFIGVAYVEQRRTSPTASTGSPPARASSSIGAYSLIAFWQFNQSLRRTPRSRPTSRRRATPRAIRSTSRSSRPPSSAPSSGSCGGTRPRPRSSWATSARWPSAASSPRWRSSPAPNCCSSSSPASSSSGPARSSCSGSTSSSRAANASS